MDETISEKYISSLLLKSLHVLIHFHHFVVQFFYLYIFLQLENIFFGYLRIRLFFVFLHWRSQAFVKVQGCILDLLLHPGITLVSITAFRAALQDACSSPLSCNLRFCMSLRKMYYIGFFFRFEEPFALNCIGYVHCFFV